MGGGLLTPYGKGIATTQSLISQEPDESEEGRYVQAFQARVLNYKTETETRTFPMQLDYLAQFKVTDSIWVSGILAVAPKPKNESPEDEKSPYQRLYGREVMVTWVLRAEGFSEDRLQLGLGALPMGVGLVDHTAYVRQENRRFVTDLPIQLKYYWGREKYFGHAFLYRPNPQEEVGNKETGHGVQAWWRPIPHIAIGIQGLSGESDSILRREGGFLLKAGMGRFAYLAEVDRTWREVKDAQSEFRQWAWHQQLSFYAFEHLHIYTSLQGLERDREFLTRERREAIGAEWRIWKYITLAFESRTRVTPEIKEKSQLLQLYVNGW
jgi:hypothetical protein